MNERAATLNDLTNPPSLSTIRRAAWCAGPGPDVHYAVANDSVYWLGEGHGGAEVRVFAREWEATDPRTGLPCKLDLADSHRIETAFHTRLSGDAGGFVEAGVAPTQVEYLQIGLLQALAWRLGNPARSAIRGRPIGTDQGRGP